MTEYRVRRRLEPGYDLIETAGFVEAHDRPSSSLTTAPRSADLVEALFELQREQRDIQQERDEQNACWRELMTCVEHLVRAVDAADRRREALEEREESWRERFEATCRQARETSGMAIVDDGLISDAAARPEPLSESALVQPRVWGQARPWSVYDPDSGRLVATLAELRRLLTRWYPNLRSEDDRIREFLRLPNAEPLPEQLRIELQQAGYLERPEPS